jgi:hypothetical protein
MSAKEGRLPHLGGDDYVVVVGGGGGGRPAGRQLAVCSSQFASGALLPQPATAPHNRPLTPSTLAHVVQY